MCAGYLLSLESEGCKRPASRQLLSKVKVEVMHVQGWRMELLASASWEEPTEQPFLKQ
jgi:hypothetical protein